MQKGGYIIISITDIDIYNKLQVAMKINKPILFYEDTDVCYFIDTISGGEVTSEIIDDEEVFTYHDIIMKKGSKTFTITSANAVSSEGEIQLTPDNFYPLLENIKDASGNLRFIEGEGIISELPTGVTNVYNKWSLSGTHLMFVAVFDLVTGAELTQDSIIITYSSLPQWIVDKISVLWGVNLVDQKVFNMNNPNTSSSDVTVQLRKEDNTMVIKQRSTATLSVDRSVRFQFDLLIDNGEEE